MKIYILKKLKNRKYDSEDLLWKVLFEEGIKDCEVKRAENGQLLLLSSCGASVWNVSVSHTKNYWVCALYENGAVGVDIEESSREINKGLARMLHPSERQYLEALSSDSGEWKREFLNIWTRKESFIKCLGTGLSEGLSTFSVVNGQGEPAEPVTGKNGESYYVSNVHIAKGLCAGICTKSMESLPEITTLRYSGTPFKPALEQAADMLALRDYSSAGLVRKLVEKGHSPEAAAAAAEEMSERGYIDDCRYGMHLAERGIEKGKGKYRIKRELQEKGLDETLIQGILSKICDAESGSERERAFKQASCLLGYAEEEQETQEVVVPTEKELNKVGRKLSALGYEPSVIYEIIDRLRR